MPDLNARVVRRLARALALTPAVLLPLVAAPALAATPEGWPDADATSPLDFLIVLLVIPLGLAVAIALLASVPSMIRGNGYTPGRAWRNESEWFGGPQAGLESADRVAPEVTAGETQEHEDRGGASARW